MQGLYKQICEKTKDVEGLLPVEQIVSQSGLSSAVTNKLISLGFKVQDLGQRNQAILFTALTDIIVVAKNNSFYLATLSVGKLNELKNLNMLLPPAGDKDLSGVDKLLRANTLETLNSYLLQRKFHLIKLNMYDKCKTSCSLFTCSTMNPYPDLVSETVYSLTAFANWHNNLYNKLVTGVWKLDTTNGEEICQNYLSRTSSLPTSGVLLTRDLDNNLKEIPLLSVRGIEPYTDNDFVSKLLSGVVNYDGLNITLNRDILDRYYGTNTVNGHLESKMVRYRYCLEELLSRGSKWALAYYINKYQLDIYDCDDIYELQARLRKLIKPDTHSNIINARVLTSVEQVKAGHRSYYVRINLDKLASHSISVVEDTTGILPQTYEYYAISPSLGYNKVEVNATSDKLALKYGETEFERQFGKDAKFSGLSKSGVVIKGIRGYKMGIDIQRSLCQNIMYGYRDNYKYYSQIIYDILRANKIYCCTDECIRLLYINSLARKYRYGADVKLIDVIDYLVQFMELLSDSDKLNTKLLNAKVNISYRNCCKEYDGIVKALPMLNGYKIDDTPDGKYVVTLWGRYKLTKDGVGKKVTLLYNEEKIGCKMIK